MSHDTHINFQLSGWIRAAGPGRLVKVAGNMNAERNCLRRSSDSVSKRTMTWGKIHCHGKLRLSEKQQKLHRNGPKKTRWMFWGAQILKGVFERSSSQLILEEPGRAWRVQMWQLSRATDAVNTELNVSVWKQRCECRTYIGGKSMSMYVSDLKWFHGENQRSSL